jgi:hypothetical protein
MLVLLLKTTVRITSTAETRFIGKFVITPKEIQTRDLCKSIPLSAPTIMQLHQIYICAEGTVMELNIIGKRPFVRQICNR